MSANNKTRHRVSVVLRNNLKHKDVTQIPVQFKDVYSTFRGDHHIKTTCTVICKPGLSNTLADGGI